MSENLEYLKDYLEKMVSMRKSIVPLPKGIHWAGIEDLVLNFGKSYELIEKPDYLSEGTPTQCFQNSAEAVFEHDKFLYVEGFALLKDINFPIHHAWIAEKGTTKAIDVTSDRLEGYFGVCFSLSYLRKHWRTRKNAASLLDNWEGGFPLLKMDRGKIQKILA